MTSLHPEPPQLSVVVPVFGNGATLARNIAALEAALTACEPRYEVIIVVDGDPGAKPIAETLEAARVHVVSNDEHRGKGFAVATGLRRARGELVGFMDAGGDIDPSIWATLLALQRERDADAVVGSKWHPDSIVAYPIVRWAYSYAYHALVRTIFRLNIRDTQVGAKLFRADLVRDVAPLSALIASHSTSSYSRWHARSGTTRSSKRP